VPTLAIAEDLSMSGTFRLTGNAVVTGGASISGVTTMTGNVGIGTASPAATLDVNGLIRGQSDFGLQASSNGWNGSLTKGLYMRYSTNGVQDSGYIQSVDRTTGIYHPLGIEASKFVFTGGNVGIGTNNPAATLHINGGIAIQGTNFMEFGYGITKESSAGKIGYTTFGSGLTIVGAGVNNQARHVNIYDKLGINIGTDNPVAALDVRGGLYASQRSTFGAGINLPVGSLTYEIVNNGSALTIYRQDGVGVFLASGATGWSGNSDIRLKTNITNVPLCLNKINNLRPVFYNWISSPNERQNIGFIAQEVEEIFPELISEIYNESLNDNTKALSMTDFIPYMVKGMQEQQVLIQDQQVLIQSQQSQIDALVARLAAAGIA
jgi:hypothetical protein